MVIFNHNLTINGYLQLWVLQKWPKIAKMTQNDLLTLKMVFTEPLRKTEQNSVLKTLF